MLNMNMLLPTIFLVFHFGLVSSQMISMPLKDNMQATLKADLDVDEMNKYLKTYIQQEVKKGVEDALASLVKNIVQNQTEKAELRTIERIEERQHYAFFASLPKPLSSGSRNPVLIFRQVSTNVGSAYSGETGKFTCKVVGVYCFSWTTVTNPESQFLASLAVNGNKIAGNAVSNRLPSGGFLSSSSTVIVTLQKGDLVWIEIRDEGNTITSTWYSVPCTIFSGFKIN